MPGVKELTDMTDGPKLGSERAMDVYRPPNPRGCVVHPSIRKMLCSLVKVIIREWSDRIRRWLRLR